MKQFAALFSLVITLTIAQGATAQNLEIYVSDANGNQIYKYDENGDNGVVFIDSGELNWPQDILFLEHLNEVLISSLNSGRITRHAISTGAYLGDFANGLPGPTRMEIGPDSLIYIIFWQSNSPVKRYEFDGTFVDDFTNTGNPLGIGFAFDDSLNFYTSSYGQGQNPPPYVRKYDAAGQQIGAFVSPSDLNGPVNIWFDKNGSKALWVLDYNAGNIKEFDSLGAYQGILSAGLNFPEGVAFFPDNSFLIGNGGTGAVKHFDASGTFIEDLVLPNAAGLIRPNAVRIREAGNVGLTPNASDSQTFIFQNTAGTSFKIAPKAAERFDAIRLIDASGNLVTTIDVQQAVWTADSNASGIYFVLGMKNNVEMARQKITINQ